VATTNSQSSRVMRGVGPAGAPSPGMGDPPLPRR
jgi:hypothetical protein